MTNVRTLRYPRVGFVAYLLVVVSVVVFLAWYLVFREPNQGILMGLAACTWELWGILRNPYRFDIGGETLTVFSVVGGRRMWKLSELRMPMAKTNFGYLRAMGGPVLDSYGNTLFRVSPFVGYFELIEAIEPGARNESEKRAEESWWSRNIL